jgi:hypothetical protein
MSTSLEHGWSIQKNTNFFVPEAFKRIN